MFFGVSVYETAMGGVVRYGLCGTVLAVDDADGTRLDQSVSQRHGRKTMDWARIYISLFYSLLSESRLLMLFVLLHARVAC